MGGELIKETDAFMAFVDSLVADKESDELEFKSALGGFPRSLWETYSSFANTDGGIIILGVSEKKGDFKIEGIPIEDAIQYKKEFWDNVNNTSKVSINLMKDSDVSIEKYNDKCLLVLRVPRADATQKPVYLAPDPNKGTYKRNDEGDYLCTRDEVRRMFADADMSFPPDSRILDKYSIEDIDLDTFSKYKRLFRLAKPDHPWLSLPDIELLKKLRAYRKDRKTGKEGFTLAGILMFGKTDSITDPDCAPYFYLDYRDVQNDSESRWEDRLVPDGTWEANLFEFYLRVIPKLIAVLPKPFILKDNIRRDETPASIAIREAFINALIHADYSVNASTIIEHHNNGFVFSNPGTMLISKSQYYRGGDSVCRNSTLQKMFMMIGSAEKAGSGADKILSGWVESDWKKPVLDIRTRPDKVVLTLPMESLLPAEAESGLCRLYGEGIRLIGRNKLIALSLAYTEGEISNDRLRYATDMHRTDISHMLKDLCNDGYLVASGVGRGTTYQLKRNETLAPNIETSAPNIETSAPNIETLAPNIETSAQENQSGAYYVSNTATLSGNRMDEHESPEQRKKKMARVELEDLIIKNCSEFITIEELSRKVGRTISYLRTGVLKKMVAEKKLQMLFPGKLHHPNQKYKVSD
jgi:ATP-dependent DNA helicase RecG